MQVILRRNWFVVGRRFRHGEPQGTPIEIPDHLRPLLPKSAKVVEGDVQAEVVKVPEPPVNELHMADLGRAIAESEETARNKAEEMLKQMEDERKLASRAVLGKKERK